MYVWSIAILHSWNTPFFSVAHYTIIGLASASNSSSAVHSPSNYLHEMILMETMKSLHKNLDDDNKLNDVRCEAGEM